MAKGQRSEVGGQPEPVLEAALVTVVAVERLFVAAEARYVEPGETVALPELTALVLVEVGAAARARSETGLSSAGETATAAAASQ